MNRCKDDFHQEDLNIVNALMYKLKYLAHIPDHVRAGSQEVAAIQLFIVDHATELPDFVPIPILVVHQCRNPIIPVVCQCDAPDGIAPDKLVIIPNTDVIGRFFNHFQLAMILFDVGFRDMNHFVLKHARYVHESLRKLRLESLHDVTGLLQPVRREKDPVTTMLQNIKRPVQERQRFPAKRSRRGFRVL